MTANFLPSLDQTRTITFGIYTHAVSTKKREAQSKVVQMVLPPGRKQPVVVTMGGTA